MQQLMATYTSLSFLKFTHKHAPLSLPCAKCSIESSPDSSCQLVQLAGKLNYPVIVGRCQIREAVLKSSPDEQATGWLRGSNVSIIKADEHCTGKSTGNDTFMSTKCQQQTSKH